MFLKCGKEREEQKIWIRNMPNSEIHEDIPSLLLVELYLWKRSLSGRTRYICCMQESDDSKDAQPGYVLFSSRSDMDLPCIAQTLTCNIKAGEFLPLQGAPRTKYQ
jgi:hypothetical protein